MQDLDRALDATRPSALDPTDARIAARLRFRRRLLGMTLEDVGAAANMRFQRVHKYESGASRIFAGDLWRLARALNVQVDYFFDDLRTEGKSPTEPRSFA